MSGDGGLCPAKDNAWFDSRVMSRSHAIVRAEPHTRLFTIEDINSMHGTQCNGKRLKTEAPQLLVNQDTLVFGADVTRGSCTYPLPLWIPCLLYANFGSAQFRALKVMPPLQPPSFRNTFSADYSEEDMSSSYYPLDNWAAYAEDERSDGDGDDDEVEIVKESVRFPSVEVVIQRRDESVIVSEDSDRASSYFSEGEVDESPTSSPLGLNDDRGDNSCHDSSAKVLHDRENDGQEELAGDFPSPDPAQYVIQAEAVGMRSHSDSLIPASSLGSTYDSGSSSINKPLAQLHPSDAARAPSPSEVAMVKPTPEVIIQQPFLQQAPTYRDVPSYLPDLPGRDSTWDGPSWDLLAPRFVVSGDSCFREFRDAVDAHCMTHPTSQGPPFTSLPTLAAQYPYAPPAQAPDADPTPKCSIAQLLDETKTNNEQERSIKKSLKRRVDEISDNPEENQYFGTHDLTVHNKDLEPEPVVESSQPLCLPAEHKSNVTSIPHLETKAQSAGEMVSEAIETPPRKKAKKDRRRVNDGGSFMKMAAATIAGVAIGTVGTIVGLASLPQDYFV
ncbi:uncharacterized protein A1O9_00979 [Exophiala aquamarina CBS 119918]|uniref:FHA domain-containing protein n=1 Tax=Exophiala aquamarina CBS 119918 TaxID=1182545 RepID=A0A072PSC1_9EURO|nr:uncharacterized protein A1O9_00979 [Exophiala aquamarina CBS 119918]KEF63004.1 hypothetical protein A1O9_00979 [Exophiala aquamarina CBS 119918]